jgi:SEC-C motif
MQTSLKIGRNDPCHCGSGKKPWRNCRAVDLSLSALIDHAAKSSRTVVFWQLECEWPWKRASLRPGIIKAIEV